MMRCINYLKNGAVYMKCPSCGAESAGTFCEYCGSELPINKNSAGTCPKCRSENITFKRERIGTVSKRTSHKNIIGTNRTGWSMSQTAYRTVGLCQNCGHTWSTSAGTTQRKTWLWVLGWIFIFPVPLTILMLKKKEMKPALRYGVIAVAWVVYLAIAIFSPGETSKPQNAPTTPNEGLVEDAEASETVTPGEYIESVVSKYNERATEKLVFVEDFTPSDKASGHYRTEFRLTAYRDAVGKCYSIGEEQIDLIAAPSVLGEISFRIYAYVNEFEQVIELVQNMSPVIDESLTATELQNAITEVTTQKEANGYYYGELGLVLTGNDAKGYDLMIKKD